MTYEMTYDEYAAKSAIELHNELVASREAFQAARQTEIAARRSKEDWWLGRGDEQYASASKAVEASREALYAAFDAFVTSEDALPDDEATCLIKYIHSELPTSIRVVREVLKWRGEYDLTPFEIGRDLPAFPLSLLRALLADPNAAAEGQVGLITAAEAGWVSYDLYHVYRTYRFMFDERSQDYWLVQAGAPDWDADDGEDSAT